MQITPAEEIRVQKCGQSSFIIIISINYYLMTEEKLMKQCET